MIRIRSIVDDVDEAVEFYTSHLDFGLQEQFGPAIDILARDGVQLPGLRTQVFGLKANA